MLFEPAKTLNTGSVRNEQTIGDKADVAAGQLIVEIGYSFALSAWSIAALRAMHLQAAALLRGFRWEGTLRTRGVAPLCE